MKEKVSQALAFLMILSIFDEDITMRKDLTPMDIYKIWEKAEFVIGGN